MEMSKPITIARVKEHALSTFVIHALFHIYQKEKIAVKIANFTNS